MEPSSDALDASVGDRREWLHGLWSDCEVDTLSPRSSAAPLSSVADGLLRRAAVLGAATGLRSTAGLVVLAWRWSEGPSAPFVRTAAAAVLCTELVFDKLPTTRSRLDARPLGGRRFFAGVGGAALAGSNSLSVVARAALASTGVLVSVLVCTAARLPLC